MAAEMSMQGHARPVLEPASRVVALGVGRIPQRRCLCRICHHAIVRVVGSARFHPLLERGHVCGHLLARFGPDHQRHQDLANTMPGEIDANGQP